MTVQLPFEQAHPLQVAPLLRQLQQDGVVHRVRTMAGDQAWLVTGYEEARRLLADDRLGRSHPDPAKAARMGESALFGGPMGNYDTELADNARLRALLQPHFSPRRMRAFRSRVDELTAGLLTDLAEHGPPADLHQALALPLPIQVICELLGVPYADRAQFRAWSEAVGDVRDRARSGQGLGELFGYGQQLVARKREQPGDDFISRLCADGLGDDEIAMLSMGLLFAGHETTVVAIGMGALCLLAHPGQQQALIDDPGQITSAVEEILRARAGAAAASPATPVPTCRSGRLPCARVSWCCWTTAPPTTIPRSSPALIASTSPARGRPISRSDTAPTTASAPRLPASNCRRSSPSCWRASPRCGSPSRSSSCGCDPGR